MFILYIIYIYILYYQNINHIVFYCTQLKVKSRIKYVVIGTHSYSKQKKYIYTCIHNMLSWYDMHAYIYIYIYYLELMCSSYSIKVLFDTRRVYNIWYIKDFLRPFSKWKAEKYHWKSTNLKLLTRYSNIF